MGGEKAPSTGPKTVNGPSPSSVPMRATSAAACIEAGYDLLHLDLAAGPLDADAPLPIDTLIDQTVILLHHAESVRRAQDRAPIAYEVDTDEARGGLQDEDRMRTFLRRFRTALDDRDLPDPSRGSSSGRCFPIADGAWCVLRSAYCAAECPKRMSLSSNRSEFVWWIDVQPTRAKRGPKVMPLRC